MGAWGVLAFDNDTTNDWAYGLKHVDDLSLVEKTFDEFEHVGADYLDSDIACNALAHCETLARLLGHAGYTNVYTETVDRWVATHKIEPSAVLLTRAIASIDRMLVDNSELRDLWEDSEFVDAWYEGTEDLRARLRA